MIILFGIAAFLLEICSFVLYGFLREGAPITYGTCIMIEVVGLLFCAMYLRTLWEERTKYRSYYEQTILWGVAFVVLMVPLFRYVPTMIKDRDIFYYVFVLAMFLLFGWILVLDLRETIGCIRKSVSNFNDNYLFLIIAAILIAFSYEKISYSLWDANSMFRAVEVSEIDTLFMIHRLTFYRHLSFIYRWMAAWFKIVFKDAVISQMLYGRLLLLLGAFGFWKLFRLLFGAEKKVLCALLTLSYAVSPYFLGMVTYNYLDTASWYLLPILTYELYSKKWINSIFIGCFFVFTKELNVVTYVFLVIGLYLVESIRKKKLIHNLTRYCFLAIPAVLFVVAYCVMPRISNLGGFINVSSYTKAKLESFFCYNFNWLMLILIALGIVVICYKRDGETLEKMFPTLLSAIVFTVLSCHLNTSIFHARYIDALIAQIYILEAISITVIFRKELLQKAVLILQCLLLLVSSFWSIDPVMLNTFRNVNVGSANIVYGSEMVSDGWCYNRQYNNFGYIVDMALEDCVKDSEATIYFPAEYCTDTWHFDAMGEYHILDDSNEYVLEEKWDSEKKTRMVDERVSDHMSFNVHVVAPAYTFELEDGQTAYFLFTEYDGVQIAEDIKKHMKVEETTFEKGGWKINRIKFTKAN